MESAERISLEQTSPLGRFRFKSNTTRESHDIRPPSPAIRLPPTHGRIVSFRPFQPAAAGMRCCWAFGSRGTIMSKKEDPDPLHSIPSILPRHNTTRHCQWTGPRIGSRASQEPETISQCRTGEWRCSLRASSEAPKTASKGDQV